MEKPVTPAEPVLSFCCGGKKCPEFTVKDGGVSVTDAAIMQGNSIDLSKEQATELRAWLQARGF